MAMRTNRDITSGSIQFIAAVLAPQRRENSQGKEHNDTILQRQIATHLSENLCPNDIQSFSIKT